MQPDQTSAPSSTPSTASLHGVKVGCFYPWNPFEPTGAWTRFTCLWRYLLEEGAEVTIAFLTKGVDAKLQNITVTNLGEYMVFNNLTAIAKVVAKARTLPELKQYSPVELDFLLRYEHGLYLSNPKTGPWLEEIIARQDLITCEYPLYAPLLSGFCKKAGKPLLVTSLDMLFELHGVHPRAKMRLKEKEVNAMRLADALVFCNEKERLAFAQYGLHGHTVLNTGDVLAIEPGKEDESREMIRANLKVKTAHFCLFVGSAHDPNREAAEEVRRMAKAMPDLTFVVVGKCCTPAVEGNFISLGQVNDKSLDLLYRGAFAVIVPLLRGTGMSIKFFQALIYGKPVVATPIGARGFAVAHEREFLLAETAAHFPGCLRRLRDDADLRARIAVQGRAYALELDFRRHFAPYGDLICRLTKRAKSTHPRATRALLLVDNNLTDRAGHHFNYAFSLKEQCAAMGRDFRALIKQSAVAEIAAELGAVPAFTQGIHEENPSNPYPKEWTSIRATYDFLLSNDQFARELEAGLASTARPFDCVFLPNASPRQILGLALLLQRAPLYRMLKFVLIFRYSLNTISGPITARKVELDKDSAEKHEIAISRLLSVDQLESVRLATDSAGLAEEYASIAKRPLEVLPIPHTAQHSADAMPAGVPAKDSKKIRIVYLGDAREEKGFEFLPAVVRACAAAAPQVEFVLQAFITSTYHIKMAEVITELEELRSPNLHLVKDSLSTDDYQALLNSADLVLLPYDAATYGARTSGPFVEAICADKPVVVPNNSWMSAQLGESRAGTTFKSGDAKDLARAVVAALGNMPLHAYEAAELGRKFRAYHNPRNFVARLLEIPADDVTNQTVADEPALVEASTATVAN